MKVFQSLQKYMAINGLQPSDPNQKYSSNWKTYVNFVFFVKHLISLTLGFVYEADTFGEHAESFFASTTDLVSLFIFIVLHSKIGTLTELIDKFGNMIEKRKFQCYSNSTFDLFIYSTLHGMPMN